MATGRPQTMRACTASHTVSSGCQGLRSTLSVWWIRLSASRKWATGSGKYPSGLGKLGRMDERRLKIEDHEGRWVRKKVLPMSPD